MWRPYLEVGTGMHPEMTARQNIYLNGSLMGMRRHEITSKLDEIVDFAGIGKYIDTPIKRFSSGMKVRLGFAVAAFLDPEILIVDEVLAVGDAEFQKKAIGKMQDVSKGEGRTVLFVSHNMISVKNLCNKAIVLENGSIQYSNSSEKAIGFYMQQLYDKSKTPLIQRNDRKGNKKLEISKIFVEDNKKNKVVELHSGKEYFITFEYIKTQIIDPKQLTIVLTFKNENEEVATTIATDELGMQFKKIPSEGTIKVHIPRLQFREGNYALTIMISEKLSFNTPHEVIDYIPNALILNVIRGDYWNSGILNRPKGFIQEADIQVL